MKKSLDIFRRDLLRILRNPIAAIVALGICVVPCLYAWINIAANWDPYQNTSDMPVAVVNEDQPVEVGSMGTICTGDMMVEALHQNDKIGWRFMDESEALEGVRAGTYYAAIVIPPDFTARITGILDGNTEKAALKYYVNEKVNAIAPKVTDTGATTVETQVRDKFVATVGKVVSERVGDAVDSLVTDSKEGLGRASTELGEAGNALVAVNEQLGTLSASLTTAQDALNRAADDLSTLEGKGAQVANNLQATLDGIDQTRANANQLMGNVNQGLSDAAGSITSLTSQASHDISSLAGDISLAQSQVRAAIRALESDLTDDEGLKSSLTTAREAVLSTNPTSESSANLRADIERELDTELGVVVSLSDSQQARLNELRTLDQDLQAAAEGVATLSQTVSERAKVASDTIASAQAGTVATNLRHMSSAIDSLVQSAQQLEVAARAVDPVVSQTVSVSREFSQTLGGTATALAGTQSSLADLEDEVSSLSNDLLAIQASEAWDLLKTLTATNPEAVREFLSAPVEVNEERLFPVDNYASGVAPFFTSLALWVGGIALVAIFKLEVDDEDVGRVRPWQAYFGRWTLFVLLGLLQAIICCTGDLVLGIQCAHPWAFYLSGMVASFVFVNVIFALSVAFKHVGKALAFLMVILQVPGSAGMYPIEMMPPFFQAINPWLPFTYSNNAMREAIAGFYDGNLAKDLLMLLLFVVPSLLVGVTARGRLVNVNALFDQRLRDSDHLFVSEPVAIEANRFRLATVVKALHAPEEYRAAFEERSASFEQAYPRLVRSGIMLLFLVPLVLFALMLVHDAKLPLLACWVASIVLICSFLIVVEYLHDRVARKIALTDLPASELEEVLNDTLRDELLPLAPIDALIERRNAREGGGLFARIHEIRSLPAAPEDEDKKGGEAQ